MLDNILQWCIIVLGQLVANVLSKNKINVLNECDVPTERNHIRQAFQSTKYSQSNLL